MSSTRILFLVSAGLAYLIPAITFLIYGNLGMAALALLCGVAWCLAGLERTKGFAASLRQPFYTSLWFGLACLLAIYLGFSSRGWWLGLVVVASALCAWDLLAFRQRLFPLSKPQGAGSLVAFHLRASNDGENIPDVQRDGWQELDLDATGDVVPGTNGERLTGQAGEKSHLRALGIALGLGLGITLAGQLITSMVQLPGVLALGLVFSLLLALGLILLARSLLRL